MRHARLKWIAGTVTVLALLVAIGALFPVDNTDLVSHPAPVTSYAASVRRIKARQQADDTLAAPGGRTMLLTHGARTARVVVLLHGFTNSPSQFAPLGAILFNAGDNVYIPRLPRHAQLHGSVAALGKLSAEELATAADSAIDVASGLGDSVIVAGLSAGGTMAAWIAQHRPVRRAVIIAPVFRLSRVPEPLSDPLTNLAVRIPNLSWSQKADPTEPDRELGVSTRAVAELLRLGSAVRVSARDAAPQTRDVVFVTNAHDRTVATGPAVQMARDWSSFGISAVVYQFPDSLRLRHDVVDLRQAWAKPEVVYPALEALIQGSKPPPVMLGHRLFPRP